MNPLTPINNVTYLKIIGESIDEHCELSSAIEKCILNYAAESESITRNLSRAWLDEDVADVVPNLELLVSRFNFNETLIIDRPVIKKERLIEWPVMPEEKRCSNE